MEVVVVIVVMAIIATFAMPRLGNQEARKMQLAADGVADLLMMFGQREALERKPVAIWHDAERNFLVLLVLERADEDGDGAGWQRDPFVAPVRLPDMIDANGVQGYVDGEYVDMRNWPIAVQPGNPRPTIDIVLSNFDGASKRVTLPAHATAPHQDNNAVAADQTRQAIDLDATGRNREDW